MPELRRDVVKHLWVIIATERALRPSDFKVENPMPPEGAICPFCPDNEKLTPPEIQAFRPNGGKNVAGWRVRVIPNKFPALRIEGDLDRRGYGMYDVMNGVGAHEVIIETPDHNVEMSAYSQSQMEDVLWSYQKRLEDLNRDQRFRYLLIFKNHGLLAGASLHHPHSQLMALPVVPIRISEKLDSCKNYFSQKERCLICDIISQEEMMQERVVMQEDDFTAVVPYAARFPFEITIYPRKHGHDYMKISKSQVSSLAYILRATLKKLNRVLGSPAYNVMLHTAPVTSSPHPAKPDMWRTIEYDYHWHIEIIPRVTREAGFEKGTGFYINPITPESAAKYLRNEPIDD